MQLLFALEYRLSYCSLVQDNSSSFTQKPTSKRCSKLSSHLGLELYYTSGNREAINTEKLQKARFLLFLQKRAFIGAADWGVCQEYLVLVWGYLLGPPAAGCSPVVTREASTVFWKELFRADSSWNGLAAVQQNSLCVGFPFSSVMKRLVWNYFICFVLLFTSCLCLFFPLACVFLFFTAARLHVRLLFIAFPQQMESPTSQWNVLLPKSTKPCVCVRTSKGSV